MKFKTTDKDDWFKPKHYLHFDSPLSDGNRKNIEKLVMDPLRVSQHSFYPFITYEVTKYKMNSHKDGRRFLDDSKKRPLSYAAHLDSQIYSYYSKAMSILYEDTLLKNNVSDNVIAYRKLVDPTTGEGKCNIHLANDAFEAIKKVGDSQVYAFDIKSFFDKLDHAYLKSCWIKLLSVNRLPQDHYTLYKSLTSHSVVLRSDLYDLFKIPKKNPKGKGFSRICTAEEFRNKVRKGPRVKESDTLTSKGLIKTKSIGIPQGSPISSLLANIYMLEFDISLNNRMNKLGGKYFRYCDDLLCIIPIENDFEIEKYIIDELLKLNLPLNTKKTESSTFFTKGGELLSNKPIQYLGFMFDGRRKYIRTSSIARYRRKARKAIKLAYRTMKKHNQIRAKKGLAPRELFKKKLYEDYYHTGKCNFITYGLRAAKIMNSNEIKRQIKKLNEFFYDKINT